MKGKCCGRCCFAYRGYAGINTGHACFFNGGQQPVTYNFGSDCNVFIEVPANMEQLLWLESKIQINDGYENTIKRLSSELTEKVIENNGNCIELAEKIISIEYEKQEKFNNFDILDYVIKEYYNKFGEKWINQPSD